MRAVVTALAAAALCGPAAARDAISPARLSDLTRELASDAYEGRKPGTAGEQKTVDFLVAQYKALGLKPAGPDGKWVQDVPLLKLQVQGAPQVTVKGAAGEVVLDWPARATLGPGRGVPEIAIDGAPVVFVGFGADAPERGWDDFKGVDLGGKVAVFLVNDPDYAATPADDAFGRFGGKTMTVYGRWAHKFETAARRGAVAALVIHETDAAGYGWNVASASAGGSYALDDPDAKDAPLAQGWLSREAAEDLLRLGGGPTLEALKAQARSRAFRPLELGLTLTARADVSVERVVSRNVLAKVPGTRAPGEAIVIGAHWDAFGASKGAIDNGLGVAGLVELARAFQTGPKPRRSVVFAAWTAEEQGLLGAEYYVRHPTVPLDRTVANLTMDVLQTAGRAKNAILIGRGQSELEDRLETAAAAQGRVVTGEAYPERGLFFRSDHYAFAKRGVPALLFMALGGGIDLRDGGKEAGDAWTRAYTERCYHQACDAWSPDWDLGGAAEDVDLLYRVARGLADGSDWPAWKSGSEFRRPGRGR